jgi:hypothetical protein
MKTLVQKFVLAALLVGGGQIAVGNLTEDRRFPKRDEIDAEIAGGADLLLLGDSVMRYTFKGDQDERQFREMLRDGLAPRKVAICDGPAFGAEMYLDVANYVLGRGVRPRAIVVPVNLRSFSLLWDRMPHFQLAGDRARLRWGDTLALAVHRPFEIYHVYSRLEGYPPSEKEHQELPVYRGSELLGTLREVLEGQGKWAQVSWNERAFSVIYLYPLDSTHRKIRALQKLADLCRSQNIPLLAYVTPIDVEGGTRALGPGFRRQVSANIDVIGKALAEHGARLLDLSFTVKGDQFDWNPFPNEHLKAAGRRWLAEQLIGRLKAGGF